MDNVLDTCHYIPRFVCDENSCQKVRAQGKYTGHNANWNALKHSAHPDQSARFCIARHYIATVAALICSVDAYSYTVECQKLEMNAKEGTK